MINWVLYLWNWRQTIKSITHFFQQINKPINSYIHIYGYRCLIPINYSRQKCGMWNSIQSSIIYFYEASVGKREKGKGTWGYITRAWRVSKFGMPVCGNQPLEPIPTACSSSGTLKDALLDITECHRMPHTLWPSTCPSRCAQPSANPVLDLIYSHSTSAPRVIAAHPIVSLTNSISKPRCCSTWIF